METQGESDSAAGQKACIIAYFPISLNLLRAPSEPHWGIQSITAAPFKAANKRMWLCVLASHCHQSLRCWSLTVYGRYGITLEGVMSPGRRFHPESPWQIRLVSNWWSYSVDYKRKVRSRFHYHSARTRYSVFTMRTDTAVAQLDFKKNQFIVNEKENMFVFWILLVAVYINKIT